MTSRDNANQNPNGRAGKLTVEFHPRGKSVECARCDGHGLRSVWSFGVKEPDECPDCGGSGRNWQYPNGAIASYYSGPLLGRAALSAEARDE